MLFARVNDIVLHYGIDGPEDAPVIVFSNSLGTDFRTWQSVAQRLDGRYRLICYDNRGHGLSEAPPPPYRLRDLSADLEALLEHLGVSGAMIVGLSVGGMIAQDLAARRPDLVQRLVLCDTAHKIGTMEMWNERIEAIGNGGIEPAADGILERWFSSRFRAGQTEALAGWRAMLTRTPVDGYIGTCAALRDADLTASSKTITQPTLCVGGSEDLATPPELVRSLADLIPRATFEEIEGVSHLPCIEAPDRLADLIVIHCEENSVGQ